MTGSIRGRTSGRRLTAAGARTLGVAVAVAVMLVGSQHQAQARSVAATNPSPFLVTRSGDAYTAASQTTATTYTGSLKSVVESAVADVEAFPGGGTITFAAGSFDLGSDFFILHDVHDLVFQGQGMDQTLIANVNDGALDSEPFNFSTATRVTIRDLTVSAGGVPRTTSDAIDFDNGSYSRVDRVRIVSSRARGIIFDGKGDAGHQMLWAADHNVVSNCDISGTQSAAGDGIEFLGSNDNEVYGCTIHGVANNGINATKASTTAFVANKQSNGNYIHDNTITGSARHGIVVNSSGSNRIENNTVLNSGATVAADGIRIQASDGVACDGNSVSGNTATDTQATPTQQFGLDIASSLCNGTVVGANALDGNAKDPIQDLGTGTVYLTDTLPFADGFESGDLSRWTHSSGLAVQQARVQAGSYAAEALTSGTGGAWATKQLSPSKTDVYYAIEFLVASRAPSTPINLMRFRNASAGATPIATLSISATQRVQLRDDVTGVTTLSTTVAPDGSWHEAQVHVVVAGAASRTEVWVDGQPVPELTQSGIDLGTTPIGRLELGDPLTTKTYDAFYDGVRASASPLDGGGGGGGGGAVDTTPPSPPTTLTANAVSETQVDLVWSGAADDVGVTGYLILRGGSVVDSVPATATSYSDVGLAPETSYTYAVEAVDAAGNVSVPSPSAAATTLAPALFADGFESGNLSSWTQSFGLAVQNAAVASGSWAAEARSNKNTVAYAVKRLPGTYNDLTYSARLMVMTGKPDTVDMLELRTGTGQKLLTLFNDRKRNLGYANAVTGKATTSSTSIAVGVWYELKVHVVVNGASSLVEVWLDGSKIAELGGATSLGSTPVGQVVVGESAAGHSYDFAIDDVRVTA